MVGGLIVLGRFGDEELDREGSGCEYDFRSWFSHFLNFSSFSNFSWPGLKDLTLEGVGYLGGAYGGYLVFRGFLVWA